MSIEIRQQTSQNIHVDTNEGRESKIGVLRSSKKLKEEYLSLEPI